MLSAERAWWLLLASFLPAASCGDRMMSVLIRLAPNRWAPGPRMRWVLAACMATGLYLSCIHFIASSTVWLLPKLGLRACEARVRAHNAEVCTIHDAVLLDVSDDAITAVLAWIRCSVVHARVCIMTTMILLRTVVQHPWLAVAGLCFSTCCLAAVWAPPRAAQEQRGPD